MIFKVVNIIRKIKLNKQLLSNFFSLTILQGANYILPLITLPYLVRVLGTDKFGLVMFAQAFINYFTILTDYGFNLSGTREISIERDSLKKVSEIFTSIMLIKLILIIISFLIILSFVFFIDKFNDNYKVYIYTFGIVIGQALFPVWFFQGLEKMKYVTVFNISAKLIFTIAIFIFIHDDTDFLLVPVFNSLGFILSGLLSLFVVYFIFRVNVIKPPKELIVRLFKDSSHIFISNMSISLYSTTNSFILGILTNNATVGIYTSIQKLILAIKNLYVPLYQALFPWLSKKNIFEIKIIIKKMILPILFFSLLIFSFLFIFARNILVFLYNDPIIANNTVIFRLFSVISVFASLNMLFNMLYLSAIKAYRKRMLIMLWSGIFSVITTTLLTFLWGINGTALSAVSTELLLLILGWYYYKTTDGYKVINKRF